MIWLVLASFALADIPRCVDLESQTLGPTHTSQERVGTLRNAAWIALRGYQIFISPADGAGCTMYPSCSGYAIRAARRRGIFRGMWMATARIGHQHHDPVHALCQSNGRFFRYDPPEAPYRWPPQ